LESVRLGLAYLKQEQNVVNVAWWESSATFSDRLSASSNTERSLTHSARGR